MGTNDITYPCVQHGASCEAANPGWNTRYHGQSGPGYGRYQYVFELWKPNSDNADEFLSACGNVLVKKSFRRDRTLIKKIIDSPHVNVVETYHIHTNFPESLKRRDEIDKVDGSKSYTTICHAPQGPFISFKVKGSTDVTQNCNVNYNDNTHAEVFIYELRTRGVVVLRITDTNTFTRGGVVSERKKVEEDLVKCESTTTTNDVKEAAVPIKDCSTSGRV